MCFKGGSTVIAFVQDPTGYKFEIIQDQRRDPLCQVTLRVTNLTKSIAYVPGFIPYLLFQSFLSAILTFFLFHADMLCVMGYVDERLQFLRGNGYESTPYLGE